MFNRGEIMSEEERITLYNWIENDMKDKFRSLTNNRLAYDIHMNKDKYHPLLHIIYDRLIEKEGLQFYNFKVSLCDFISYIPKTGFIHKHTDDYLAEFGYVHVRFNVFIQVPPNGMNTYYSGVQVDAKEGSYVISRSSVDIHYTEINTSNIPRISISFGFLLPREKVDNICKDMPYVVPLSHRKIFNRGIIISEEERVKIKQLILLKDLNNEFMECIKERIIKKEGLQSSLETSYYTILNGEHIPIITKEKNTIEFHIWIQVPKYSAYCYYSGIPINTMECSYSLWRGIDDFWTSPNQEDTLIILSFISNVSLQKIDELTSNFEIDMHMNYPLCV
jgi:hypothetical protein